MKYIIYPILILIWWILASVWICVGKLFTLSFDIFVNGICFLWTFKIWKIFSKIDAPYTWYVNQPKYENMEIIATKRTWHQMYFIWKYDVNYNLIKNKK